MSDVDRRTHGKRLAEARASAGLSQAKLGEVIGVSGPRISHFESGHSIPKPIHRKALAKAVHREVDELFGAIDDQRRSRVPLAKARGVSRSSQRASVNSQIMRIIDGMDDHKRGIALTLLRALSRT